MKVNLDSFLSSPPYKNAKNHIWETPWGDSKQRPLIIIIQYGSIGWDWCIRKGAPHETKTPKWLYKNIVILEYKAFAPYSESKPLLVDFSEIHRRFSVLATLSV